MHVQFSREYTDRHHEPGTGVAKVYPAGGTYEVPDRLGAFVVAAGIGRGVDLTAEDEARVAALSSLAADLRAQGQTVTPEALAMLASDVAAGEAPPPPPPPDPTPKPARSRKAAA